VHHRDVVRFDHQFDQRDVVRFDHQFDQHDVVRFDHQFDQRDVVRYGRDVAMLTDLVKSTRNPIPFILNLEP